MSDVSSSDHKKAAGQLRNVLATYASAADLINIGAYAKGSNPKIDYACEKIDAVNAFLRQGVDEPVQYEETVNKLVGMFN
jgi:flagellum-specific ATP synthase